MPNPDPLRFLDGRTALVTGAPRRVGRVLALALARAGANVAIHYGSSEAEARATADQIERLGVRSTVLQADLLDTGQVEGLVDAATGRLGPIDILINNASIFSTQSVDATTAKVWDDSFAVNLRAPFLLSRAFARALPADRKGDIVNMNDWRGLRPGADHFAYTVAKSGLHGLTQGLAVALAPRIKVNEVALGAVLPPEGSSADHVEKLQRKIPLDRWSPPEEVAEAVVYLLRAPSATGLTLYVDGGRHLV